MVEHDTEDELRELTELWRERAAGTKHPRVNDVFCNASKILEIALREESCKSVTDALRSIRRMGGPNGDEAQRKAAKVCLSELEDGINA